MHREAGDVVDTMLMARLLGQRPYPYQGIASHSAGFHYVWPVLEKCTNLSKMR